MKPPRALPKLRLEKTQSSCCCSCCYRIPLMCCFRCRDSKETVMDESCRTTTFIVLLGILCTLYCAVQAAVHTFKYLDIREFNSSSATPYDQGCFSGHYVNHRTAERLKTEICSGSADTACFEKGSNWTFVILFSGCTYGALTLNFLLMTIGACSSHVRIVSGYLFCLAGLAHLYAIYLVYMHRFAAGRYSELCELNLATSLAEDSFID